MSDLKKDASLAKLDFDIFCKKSLLFAVYFLHCYLILSLDLELELNLFSSFKLSKIQYLKLLLVQYFVPFLFLKNFFY